VIGSIHNSFNVLELIYLLLDLPFEQVHLPAGFALRFLRSALQPEVVDLRQHPVFPRHPSVTKNFPIGLVLYRRSFIAERGKKFGGCAVQRRRRIIRQLGNGICHASAELTLEELSS